MYNYQTNTSERIFFNKATHYQLISQIEILLLNLKNSAVYTKQLYINLIFTKEAAYLQTFLQIQKVKTKIYLLDIRIYFIALSQVLLEMLNRQFLCQNNNHRTVVWVLLSNFDSLTTKLSINNAFIKLKEQSKNYILIVLLIVRHLDFSEQQIFEIFFLLLRNIIVIVQLLNTFYLNKPLTINHWFQYKYIIPIRLKYEVKELNKSKCLYEYANI
ncbi:hypothetical protein ABPG72_014992 [Tetrahymena utriculariae]